jgi:anti-anti-sigma regulatory factor
VLEALAIAVALSIIDVVRRSAQPHDAVLGWVDRLGRYADVQLHPSARITLGVVIYRLDDRLFFANARYVKGRVLEAVRGAPAPTRWLIFDGESVTDVDATGLGTLTELKAALIHDDIELSVARMKPHIHARLVAEGLADSIGEDRFFPTVRAAAAVRTGSSPVTSLAGSRAPCSSSTSIPARNCSTSKLDDAPSMPMRSPTLVASSCGAVMVGSSAVVEGRGSRRRARSHSRTSTSSRTATHA